MASQTADTGLIEESRRLHLGKWKCSWALPGEHPQPPERFLQAQCDIGRVESSFRGLRFPTPFKIHLVDLDSLSELKPRN
ncbi:hypothetical protein QQF64_029661 [Cirrhinus molitorella]|uniref:Uncharacterized protein n=1 Tax=Cirrhinus molitorella TaxID=172907 RepID=A0ABR3N134_9TELE